MVSNSFRKYNAIQICQPEKSLEYLLLFEHGSTAKSFLHKKQALNAKKE